MTAGYGTKQRNTNCYYSHQMFLFQLLSRAIAPLIGIRIAPLFHPARMRCVPIELCRSCFEADVLLSLLCTGAALTEDGYSRFWLCILMWVYSCIVQNFRLVWSCYCPTPQAFCSG